MDIFRRIFDFYLRSSIHVALAVYALVRMTQHMFHIPTDEPMALFGFFGTVTGYNFVKYDELVRVRRKDVRREIKIFAVLSFLCFLAAGWCFFQLERITQIVSVSVLALTALYTLPFFPNRKNARNWAGVKIYIVSLCWVGVTVILPVLDSGIEISTDFYLKCIQRFILVFVLILIFEIIDLAKDDPHLQTVPQQIGVKRTKILGLALMMLFYFLELLKMEIDTPQLFINMVLVVLTSLFLVFANQNRSKYYSSFWTESIPILWFALVLFFG
jgi:uncharacterized membrane protein YbaN (DUF454 family)